MNLGDRVPRKVAEWIEVEADRTRTLPCPNCQWAHQNSLRALEVWNKHKKYQDGFCRKYGSRLQRWLNKTKGKHLHGLLEEDEVVRGGIAPIGSHFVPTSTPLVQGIRPDGACMGTRDLKLIQRVESFFGFVANNSRWGIPSSSISVCRAANRFFLARQEDGSHEMNEARLIEALTRIETLSSEASAPLMLGVGTYFHSEVKRTIAYLRPLVAFPPPPKQQKDPKKTSALMRRWVIRCACVKWMVDPPDKWSAPQEEYRDANRIVLNVVVGFNQEMKKRIETFHYGEVKFLKRLRREDGSDVFEGQSDSTCSTESDDLDVVSPSKKRRRQTSPTLT